MGIMGLKKPILFHLQEKSLSINFQRLSSITTVPSLFGEALLNEGAFESGYCFMQPSAFIRLRLRCRRIRWLFQKIQPVGGKVPA